MSPSGDEGKMDIKSSKPGKGVHVNFAVWWDRSRGDLHLTVSGLHGFRTTVSPDPDSTRGHPDLFMKLAKALRDCGAPHPPIEEMTASRKPHRVLRKTLAQRIIKEITKRPGLTEAQLAKALFGEDGYRQRVTRTCRLMLGSGQLERRGSGGTADPFTYHPAKQSLMTMRAD